MSPPQILVVGSYAAGLVMQTQRLPGPGETLIGHSFRSTHGGKGSNQAVQAARLGANVAFFARVGADSYGDACAKLHAGEGVDTNHLQRDAALATGVGFIVVDAAGRNLITLDMGANGALTPGVLQANPEAFASARIVLAQLEIPLETALAAMSFGRAAGATTLLNPAPAADLSAADLSCIDFLLPNETELRVCAGLPLEAPVDDAVARLLALGCRNVLVTLGEAGCTLRGADGSRIDSPAFPVCAVDTVGAGDAFCAGFATALAESQPLAAALRFANATASLSVTKPDTIPSYHARHEIESLLGIPRSEPIN